MPTVASIRRAVPALLLAMLLAACAHAPAPAPTAAAPMPALGDVGDYYSRELAAGRQVLRVDSKRSLIAITVRRGGALARFGHDHVIAVRTLDGYVAPDANRADLHFRLDQMTVDEAALRTEAGLDKQPSADDIDGTRHNMLVRVLDAEHYPLVQLHVQRAAQDGALTLAITLHGVTRTFAPPVQIAQRDGTLTASGSISFKQSDFGLVPYSLMDGALAVQDQLELRFHIVAAR